MEALEREELRIAAEKAHLCALVGLQPSEYDQLTTVERDAFVDLANRINATRNGG